MEFIIYNVHFNFSELFFYSEVIYSYFIEKTIVCSKTCLSYLLIFMLVVQSFACSSGISIVSDLIKPN